MEALKNILGGLGMFLFFGGIVFFAFGLPIIQTHRERMEMIKQGINPDACNEDDEC
jgi:hypothetical protein